MISHPGGDLELNQGILIGRDMSGRIRVLVHLSAPVYDLLKFAHRHCTRWIRLDI